MATRARTTFKKRQKELARQEKQRDKAARRMQRKLEKQINGTEGAPDDLGEMDLPVDGESADIAGESEETPPDTEPHATN